VYELKNNDWVDEGTGICYGVVRYLSASIIVARERGIAHVLFNMSISNYSDFRKQEDTLIVRTQENGLKMALSFESVFGCLRVWDFVKEVLRRRQEGLILR
jgi:protein phosphatase-4 regulatory subunit 3